MKVCQVNNCARTKSTGRTTYEMHKWLRDHGHESLVISGAEYEDDYGQVVIGSYVKRMIHGLLSRITGLQGYFSFVATLKAIKEIKRFDPDMVIIRVLHSDFINVNILLTHLKSRRCVTVIVAHDFWLITGHCPHPSDAGCLKYTTKCYNCKLIREENPSWVFDTSHKLWCDRYRLFSDWERCIFVGVSGWTTEIIRQSSIGKKREIATIGNWINLDTFCHYNCYISAKNRDGEFTILAVSTIWNDKKGIVDLIKLSHMLENDEKLVIIGDIEEDYMGKFEKDRTEFISFVKDEKILASEYNEADVYISFSERETFGKTIAEAICCETPCVTYNTAACPELVADGCGYVVPFGNVEDACNKIRLIKQYGKSYYSEALKQKRQLFDIDKCMQKYMLLCNRGEGI